MNSDSAYTVCQPFNPDQTINLSSMAIAPSRKHNSNKINLSEKINLKNHVGMHMQKRRPRSQLARKTQDNVKLQQKQRQDKNETCNQIYSESPSPVIPSITAPSNVTKPPSSLQNPQPATDSTIKLQHPPIYQPIKVNPLQKIQLGPKIQPSVSRQSLMHNPKKYKIRVLNSDFTSMRYQCFCSRQYLSYCAAYHHLKKDHYDFLKQNRRFSFTNVYQTTHPVYGYRIKKIMRERLKCPKGQNKDQVQTLGKQTKEKIKAQSPQIQKLINELKGIDSQRNEQVKLLKLFQSKLMKANELVDQYQKMIFNFQKIFDVLNIKQIAEKMNHGPTVLEEENDPQDEDYFPQ